MNFTASDHGGGFDPTLWDDHGHDGAPPDQFSPEGGHNESEGGQHREDPAEEIDPGGGGDPATSFPEESQTDGGGDPGASYPEDGDPASPFPEEHSTEEGGDDPAMSNPEDGDPGASFPEENLTNDGGDGESSHQYSESQNDIPPPFSPGSIYPSPDSESVHNEIDQNQQQIDNLRNSLINDPFNQYFHLMAYILSNTLVGQKEGMLTLEISPFYHMNQPHTTRHLGKSDAGSVMDELFKEWLKDLPEDSAKEVGSKLLETIIGDKLSGALALSEVAMHVYLTLREEELKHLLNSNLPHHKQQVEFYHRNLVAKEIAKHFDIVGLDQDLTQIWCLDKFLQFEDMQRTIGNLDYRNAILRGDRDEPPRMKNR